MLLVPKVSVILPVYNAEKFIFDAIESILNQTFSDFELIVINDGSTDRSLNIIKRLVLTDSRVKVINRENKGLVFTLNEAISLANGEYIARMDADDICHKERLYKQVEFLDNNPDVDILGTWARVFYEDKTLGYIRHPVNHNKMLVRLIFSVCFCHPSVMFRKKIIPNNGELYNLDKNNCEDYALWVNLMNQYKYANLPEVLLDYRYIESSISRQSDSDGMYIQRMESLTSISREVLDIINITLNPNEIELHFILSSNERIEKYNPGIYQPLKYLMKLNMANFLPGYFSRLELMSFSFKKIALLLLSVYKNRIVKK
ncbi:glycosyltransferase [Vibrio metschnikovii]|nr:glycosyltransferase [Vibrio metschnikovii]